jgi:hypothetical protein
MMMIIIDRSMTRVGTGMPLLNASSKIIERINQHIDLSIIEISLEKTNRLVCTMDGLLLCRANGCDSSVAVDPIR